MLASDFILETRADLQEKSEHWKDEELLIKLRRSYVSLQSDLPFFMFKETLNIKKGISEYHLTFKALQNITLKIDGMDYTYSDLENFYIRPLNNQYSFNESILLVNNTPTSDSTAEVVYKHEKKISTMNCFIEVPESHLNALGLLFLSKIHEKPTGNTKMRNLSTHYIKLYKTEILNIKKNKKTAPRGVTSKYQRV